MQVIKNIFYSVSTISIAILAAFGVRLIHERTKLERWKANEAEVRYFTGVYDPSIELEAICRYKLIKVKSSDLEKFHPLGGNKKYVSFDKDDTINLTYDQYKEFAERGLTKGLAKIIKVVEVKLPEG